MGRKIMSHKQFADYILDVTRKNSNFTFSLGLEQTGKDFHEPEIVSEWDIIYSIDRKEVGFEHFNRYKDKEDSEDMPYKNLSDRVNYMRVAVSDRLREFSLQELESKRDFYSARLIRVK